MARVPVPMDLSRIKPKVFLNLTLRQIICFGSGALIGVGAMRMTQIVRYQKSEAYRENVNTQRNDERNQFLHMKAWQMTAGWFTMIAAIATFIFKFAGREELMMLCSGGICLMITLYWVCFLYLKKKY